MSKKLTIENCQKVAEERGGKCISEKYVSNRDNLTWECSEGHRWQAPYSRVGTGGKTWCPVCSEKTRGASQRLTIDHVRAKLEGYGLELISTEYKNIHQKLKVRCVCGEIWEIKYGDLRDQFRTCRDCAIARRKYTNQERYGADVPNLNPDFAEIANKNKGNNR